MLFPALDVFGIGHAIWKLMYRIFVRGPLYLLKGLGDAISFLSGNTLIDTIFKTNGHLFGIPSKFLIFLAIAGMLIVFFSGVVIFHAIVNSNASSRIAGLINRIIIILLLLVLIPLFFWIINFTVTSLITIIMPQLTTGETLANMIGKLGFTDNLPHNNWSFENFPDWNHYSLFIGAFGAFFSLFIFFILGISLVSRIFDLFLLYITSPVVISSATIHWQKVIIWKDLVIGRFVSSLGIVLSLTLFTQLEPELLKITRNAFNNRFSQIAFSLLFIAGGAISCLKAQLLVSSIVGNTVGIGTGLSMLTTSVTAFSAVRTGTLGVFGVSRGLATGKKTNKVSSITSEIKNDKKVVSGAIAIGSKTVSGVLSTTGFLSGVKDSVQKNGFKKTMSNTGKNASHAVSNIYQDMNKKAKAKYNNGKVAGIKFSS